MENLFPVKILNPSPRLIMVLKGSPIRLVLFWWCLMALSSQMRPKRLS